MQISRTESPLAWLRSRRGPNGESLIAAEEFEAGERLRADYTTAGLGPRVTMAWETVVASGSRGRSGRPPEGLMLAEKALAARGRVHAALDAVGPELSSVLLEVCCLESGLEVAERHLGWPSRSGKVILRMALVSLARHYGLLAPALPAQRALRHWGGDGFRPDIGPAEA